MKTVELEDLEGEHELIYVERGHMQVEDIYSSWRTEDSEYLLFVLDGVSYRAVEDPSDGYRSNLRHILVDDEIPMKAILDGFPPQKVYAKMLTPECDLSKDEEVWEYSWRSGQHDVLIIYDAVTHKPVIEIGTRNTDDYYPTWQGRYNPENMAINQDVS